MYSTLDTQDLLHSNSQIICDDPFKLTLQKPNPTVGYLEELRHFHGYYHFRINKVGYFVLQIFLLFFVLDWETSVQNSIPFFEETNIPMKSLFFNEIDFLKAG